MWPLELIDLRVILQQRNTTIQLRLTSWKHSAICFRRKRSVKRQGDNLKGWQNSVWTHHNDGTRTKSTNGRNTISSYWTFARATFHTRFISQNIAEKCKCFREFYQVIVSQWSKEWTWFSEFKVTRILLGIYPQHFWLRHSKKVQRVTQST